MQQHQDSTTQSRPGGGTPEHGQRAHDGHHQATFDQPDGGQTSISPPVNVKPLASGVDTLYLTFSVDWFRTDFQSYLGGLKAKAIEENEPQPGQLADWLFLVHPYGRRGYEWLIESQEYTVRVGSWHYPIKNKPSVIVEIRSETLWRLGVVKAVDRIVCLFNCVAKAELDFFPIKDLKLSRVDLCLDILLPSEDWTTDVLDNIVCRAKNINPYLKNGQLDTMSGFRIGGSKLMACLYDKPQEIKLKGKKEWMYDVWGLKNVPEGYKIIRVEFRLLREVLKELGLDAPEDLLMYGPNLWVYCTQDWLKLQDRPGKHHTQRTTLPWWTVVQNGFEGAQNAKPLIRFKAIQGSQLQLLRQVYGLMTSLTALHQEQAGKPLDEKADLNDSLSALYEAFGLLKEPEKFSDIVFKKRSRLNRLMLQQVTVNQLRKELDLMLIDEMGGNDAN